MGLLVGALFHILELGSLLVDGGIQVSCWCLSFFLAFPVHVSVWAPAAAALLGFGGRLCCSPGGSHICGGLQRVAAQLWCAARCYAAAGLMLYTVRPLLSAVALAPALPACALAAGADGVHCGAQVRCHVACMAARVLAGVPMTRQQPAASLVLHGGHIKLPLSLRSVPCSTSAHAHAPYEYEPLAGDRMTAV